MNSLGLAVAVDDHPREAGLLVVADPADLVGSIVLQKHIHWHEAHVNIYIKS